MQRKKCGAAFCCLLLALALLLPAAAMEAEEPEIIITNPELLPTDDTPVPPVPKNTAVTYTDPQTKPPGQAEIVRLGSVESVIRFNGQALTVPTGTLTFAKGIRNKQKLAIVYAPRLGRATMRKKASVKSAMFYTCKAGVVSAVKKVGKDYTLINYRGVDGYVKTSSLSFFAPVKRSAVTTGKLSYNGKTTGKTTVNLRNGPTSKSVVVAAWPTGTEVFILSQSKGWYQVEARGVRGYVMEKYLTRDQ